MAKFTLFQDEEYFQFRWALKDDRGNVVAQPPKGFMSFEECEKAVKQIKNLMAGATFDDQTPPISRRRQPRISPND